MPDYDPSVHQTLGALLKSVEVLVNDVRQIRDEMRRSEDKSDASRAVVHKRMDDLVQQVSGLESSVSSAKQDITDMKPVTEDVKKWKSMGIGALGVVGIGGTALGVMLAGVLEQMAHFLKGS